MISAFIPEKPEFAATTEETVDYFMEASNEMNSIFFVPIMKQIERFDEKRIQFADDIIKNRPAMSRWHPDYQEETNYEIEMQS